MKDSLAIRKRFCKDNNVSITIFKSPYFEARLALLDKTEEYKEFLDMIEKHFGGSEEKYFEYYNNLKDSIINYIKSSEVYNELNNCEMGEFRVKYNNLSESDVYKVPNIGHRFISIDMIKANFSSLVHFGLMRKLKFFKSFNWESFMKKFTNIKYFHKSKYIRQVVFGNCNPKRQVVYEKYLMCNILSLILNDCIEETDIRIDDVFSMSSDEIIICIDRLSDNDIKALHRIVQKMSDIIVPVRSTEFTLGKVVGTKAYIKDINCENGEYVSKTELKCLDTLEAPFVIRAINGQLPRDEDYYFIHDGKLSRLMETPDISISYAKEK